MHGGCRPDWMLQELEAAALKVLETGQQVEGQLAQQQASLAASHTEYEEKQAQVGPAWGIKGSKG